MPRPITLTRRWEADSASRDGYPLQTEVATEEELLAFANRLRELGGADPIDALMPSKVGNASACLIATAVNFGCRVDSMGTEHEDGSLRWYLELPENMPIERCKAVAEGMGLERCGGYAEGDKDFYRMLQLPKHIGNAAHAFDSGDAFNEYRNR